MSNLTPLKNALALCNETEFLDTLESLLQAQTAPETILAACNEAMGELGRRFDQGEAFIPDLMFGGMMMKKALDVLGPRLSGQNAVPGGKTFLIGTVQHDVHDIGKDITAMILRGNGLNVIDLGVDVPAETFVQAVREHKPDFLGMSVLLTTCYSSVMKTMQALRDSGLRDGVKTCIGGAAASPLIAEHGQIDFYGKTAIDCVHWTQRF